MIVRTLSDLDPTEFENLTLDLVERLGLKNPVWRTPGRDGGRDIQGDVFDEDFSGHTMRTSWYVECKQYESTVSWPVVWEKIAYAESNCADVLHFVTTSTLSPQAIDEVNKWNEIRRRPNIRFWGRQDLNSRLDIYPDIKIKYGLIGNPMQKAAPAFLELSKILVKYSNNLAARIEFELPLQKPQTVVCALSELIAERLSQIESTGHIEVKPFKQKGDEFPWLQGASALADVGMDRFAARAVLAMIFDFDDCDSLKVERLVGTRMIKVLRGLNSDGLERDLEIVGSWGCVKFSRYDANSIILEATHANN